MTAENCKRAFSTEYFSLLLCGCGHAFVRSNKRGTSWACPRCLNEDDVDNLIETLGPERDVQRVEFDNLCGFGESS